MSHRLSALVASAVFFAAIPAAFAAMSPAGPEPYSAPDPVYAPMKSEPLWNAPKVAPVSLKSAQAIAGPAAGPEPYAAPDPHYKPMGHEPVYQPKPYTPPRI